MPDRPDWMATGWFPVNLGALERDHPTVRRDPILRGWWLELAAGGHYAYPGKAALPRGIPDAVVETMTAERVIEVDGDWYTFRGLAGLRRWQAEQTEWHRAGGRARAQSARNDRGQYVAETAGPSVGGPAGAGSAGALNGSGLLRPGPPAGPSLLAPAGAGTSSATNRHTDVELDDDPIGSSSSTYRGRGAGPAGAGRARVPDGPNMTAARQVGPAVDPCKADPKHDPDLRRLWGGSIGWRCTACDDDENRERAAERGETFTEKVAKHGGYSPPGRGA